MKDTSIKDTPKLSYRAYQDDDMEKVLELWEKYSGWGSITKEQFKNWYSNTPSGACIIIVALNTNQQIVGQIIFIPALLHLHGAEVKALRFSAPIIDSTIRLADLKRSDHPVIAMIRYGVEVARKQEHKVVYSHPAYGWLPVLRSFPRLIQSESYNCFGISLCDKTTLIPVNRNFTVNLNHGLFDDEYDRLWSDAVQNFPISCGIARHARGLNWKLGGYTVLEVRQTKSQKLEGYVALKQQTGLLGDMLASKQEQIQEILTTVIHAIHHSNPDRIPVTCSEVNGMYTPLLQSALQNINHHQNSFRFAFGCFPLDDTIAYDAIKPSSWYMMPND